MKQFYSALLLVLSFSLLSQKLEYQNDFEQSAFENLDNGTSDNLMLLMSASGDATQAQYTDVTKRIDDLVESLNPSRFAKYSYSKKVKKIFEAVQKELLIKYQLENQFAEVFENGNFNCVSATALYALVLERFEIPYEIIETPGHVYLVATPDGERLVMESTDPLGGYLQLNEKFIKNQLQSLVAMKVITAEEMNSPDLGEILDELYPSESIGLRELVALQYANQSIYDFEDENFVSSKNNAAKARRLYPHTRFDAMIYSALLQELVKRDYASPDYGKQFLEFSKVDTTAEHATMVAEEFRFMAYECLFSLDNPTIPEQIYAELENGWKPGEENRDIVFTRALLICNYLIKKGEFNEAWPYAQSAMDVYPENLDAISQFSAIVGYKIGMGGFPQPLDSMRAYMDTYPVLQDNKLWLSAYGNALIEHIYEELGVSYSNNVKREVVEFEKLMDGEPDLGVTHNNIGVAYTRLALKQFNRSKSEALKTIETGLKYAPGNKDLLRVQRMIR